MTLIMALECVEGLILASDSQATFATNGQAVKSAVRKLHLQWSNVAWGGSGSVGLIQEAHEALSGEFKYNNQFEKNGKEAKKKIAESIAKVIRPLLLNRHITIDGQQPPTTAFLFAGYSGDGPFIMEVLPDLLSVDHLVATGYAAIGSGDIFPYFTLATLAHFEVKKRTLRDAKLIAYRAIQDAINVAAFGLGPPIQMIEIVKPEKKGEPGKGHQLDDTELKQIAEEVILWKELERETLSKLHMPTPPDTTSSSEAVLEAAIVPAEKKD